MCRQTDRQASDVSVGISGVQLPVRWLEYEHYCMQKYMQVIKVDGGRRIEAGQCLSWSSVYWMRAL